MTIRIAVLGAVCAIGASQACAAEFRASYGDWAFSVSGTATDNHRQYDFKRDFAAHRGGKRSLQLAWETGPGWWKPDLALGDSSIGVNGTHTEPGGTGLPPPFPQSPVTTSIQADFRDQDLVLRYPLNAGPVKFSVGLAAKRLRGTVLITDSNQGQPSRTDYDQLFPELHLAARWPILSWLALEATAQGVQYKDSTASELRAGLELRPWGPILLEASWQQKHYDFTAGADALDVTLQGALLRAGLLLR